MRPGEYAAKQPLLNAAPSSGASDTHTNTNTASVSPLYQQQQYGSGDGDYCSLGNGPTASATTTTSTTTTTNLFPGLGSSQRRILGFLAALAVGCLFGASFDPSQYVCVCVCVCVCVLSSLSLTSSNFYYYHRYVIDHPGTTNNSNRESALIFVFPQFSGILLTSTSYTFAYLLLQRYYCRQPFITPDVLLPAFMSGACVCVYVCVCVCVCVSLTFILTPLLLHHHHLQVYYGGWPQSAGLQPMKVWVSACHSPSSQVGLALWGPCGAY